MKSQELGLLIAKHRGYVEWFHETPNDQIRGWKIVNKDGAAVCGALGFKTQDDAWDAFFVINQYHWVSDLRAAWRLLPSFDDDQREVLLVLAARLPEPFDAARKIAEKYVQWIVNGEWTPSQK